MARVKHCKRCKEGIMIQHDDDPDCYTCDNCGKEAIKYSDGWSWIDDGYEFSKAFWKAAKFIEPNTSDDGEGF